MRRFSRYQWAGVAGSVLVLAVFVLPMFSFAKSTKQLYVDDSANDLQDGSMSHPFKTIGRAIDEANGKKTDIHVAKGTYKENITLPDNVKLYGEDEEKTIIDGRRNSDRPVVTMNDNTVINKLTIQGGGNHGVRVTGDGKVSIIECVIRNNDKDGINVHEASTKDDDAVSISASEIRDNGRAGIYSEKRKVVMVETDVKNNHNDGVTFTGGVKVFFDNNSISGNGGSGLNVVLDGSSIYVASKDTFRKNNLDGIAIVSYGGTGSVIVKKSRMSENGHYGVSRIAKGNVPASVWNGVSVMDLNNYFGNVNGNISPILK